jgi:selenocysteine lyase/cysteine desulfurase
MKITRRSLAKGLGAAALLASALKRTEASISETTPSSLPDSTQFITGDYEVCLNNARWHPLSKGAKAAIEKYLEYKQRGIWQPPDEISAMQQQVRKDFASLIHADPSEIAYVNSTTAAETLFVSALGFPDLKGNIVTDALHFEGSLYLYDALKRLGVDVRVVKPRDWEITLEDMAAMIDKDTRLVSVSQVSFINGFEHRMKPLCDLAHAHGAVVYADAVQATGCIPVDVRASGVDAMGSASYKWLMGDMGLGFLYVKQDVIPKLRHTVFGYRQLAQFSYHVFPWDKPGTYPVEWKQRDDAAGFFEIGTFANSVIAALSFSLPYLHQIGVENVQLHAQELIATLRKELPALGYACITPNESKSSIVTFAVPDMAKTAHALTRARVDTSLSTGRMRISPSVYNTAQDVQKLLAALS